MSYVDSLPPTTQQCNKLYIFSVYKIYDFVGAIHAQCSIAHPSIQCENEKGLDAFVGWLVIWRRR